MKHTFSNTNSQKRGITLLISVLMVSVVLAVGIGVYNRTYKELYFSSFWKQTQLALSAADSGLECALYWQLHSGTPECFGSLITGWTWGNAGNFEKDVNGACVKVEIIATLTSTTTYARGYNVLCADILTNPRVVERGLEATYGQ